MCCLDIVTGCLPLLRPGGILAFTVRPYRHRGALIELLAHLSHAIAEHTPLRPIDRNVALVAAIRNDQLVTRSSRASSA
jgi:modification methylase